MARPGWGAAERAALGVRRGPQGPFAGLLTQRGTTSQAPPQPLLRQGDAGEALRCPCPRGCSDPVPQSSASPEGPRHCRGPASSPRPGPTGLPRRTALSRPCVWSCRHLLWPLLPWRVRAPTHLALHDGEAGFQARGGLRIPQRGSETAPTPSLPEQEGASLFFINLFIFGRTGALLRCAGFSSPWLLLSRSTDPRHAGFSSCGPRALERRLSNCGAQA